MSRKLAACARVSRSTESLWGQKVSLDKLPVEARLGKSGQDVIQPPTIPLQKDAFQLTVQCQIASHESQRRNYI